MLRKHLLGPILFGLISTAASAADSNSSADRSGIYMGPVIDAGFDFGGDTLGTVEYTDGSKQNIHTGEGGLIAGGLHLRPSRDSPFDLKATVGYKYTSSEASNANIHLDRVLFELTPNVRLPYGIWIGAGVVHQTSINFNGDGFGPDLHFKDATGANFELGWRSRTRRFFDYGVAAVYTLIDYQDEYDNRYKASSIGIRLSANFGWTVFGDQRSAVQQPLAPQIAVVPAPVYGTPMASAPVAPLASALVSGQILKLSSAHNLRRQPREESPYASSVPAGTVVTLDGQVGTFWFVRTATTVGWLRTDELQ